MTERPAPVAATGKPPSVIPAAAVNSRTAALILLVLLALVWGVHWVVVKIGLDYMPPMTYAALRVGTGLATVLGVLAAQGKLRLPPRADLPIVASVGLGQIAASIIVMNFALQVVAAGRSAILYYTMPIWVAVLLALFFGVRPRRFELVGLVLGIVGIVALFNPGSVDWSQPGELAGSLALLANAVLWAAVTIHVRRHHWTASPFELQPWQLIAALVPILVFAFVREGFGGVVWGPPTVLVLLYSGPLATAFAFWASQAITRSLGAQVAATGFLAAPVVGLAAGSIVLHEPLGPIDLLGIALVLTGVALTSLWPRPATAAGATDA